MTPSWRSAIVPTLLLAGAACGCRARAPTVDDEMATVAAGEVVLGCEASEPGCPDFGRPRRTTQLAGFRIDRYETTRAAYAACVAAGACARGELGGDDRRPVEGVSIEEARRYCGWRGKRLPSSDEWEKAARGVVGARYPWGADAPTCERARYNACWPTTAGQVTRATAEVGTHRLGDSPFGLHDVAGNAAEWTECPARFAPCVAIIRGIDHDGEAGLATYAGHLVVEPMDAATLALNPTGFRCASDLGAPR